MVTAFIYYLLNIPVIKMVFVVCQFFCLFWGGYPIGNSATTDSEEFFLCNALFCKPLKGLHKFRRKHLSWGKRYVTCNRLQLVKSCSYECRYDTCEWISLSRRDIPSASFESWSEIAFPCIAWLAWALTSNVSSRNFLNSSINKWIIVHKLQCLVFKTTADV